jgi:hypothetical protein
LIYSRRTLLVFNHSYLKSIEFELVNSLRYITFWMILATMLAACGGGGENKKNGNEDEHIQSPAFSIVLNITTEGESSERILKYLIESNTAGEAIVSGECGEHKADITAGSNTLEIPVATDSIYSGCHLNIITQSGEEETFLLPDFLIDTIKPEISIWAQPLALSNVSTVEFTVRVDEASALHIQGECSQQKVPLTKGSNSVSLENLADGDYRGCTIYAQDKVGNISSQITLSQFRIDTRSPEIEFLVLPSDYVNKNQASFSLSLNEEAVLSFEGSCSGINKQEVVQGNHRVSFADLSDGVYENCIAAATDLAGNVGRTSAIKFVMDNELPQVVESLPVLNKTDELINEVQFTANEPGSFSVSGECELEGTTSIENIYKLKIGVVGEGGVSHENCIISFTDMAGNTLSPIGFSSFLVVPKPIELVIWRNNKESVIHTDRAYSGYTLHRSREFNCDVKVISICEFGQSSLLNGEPILDASFSKDENSFVSIETDTGLISKEVLVTENTGAYTGSRGIAFKFNGRLFIFNTRWSRFETSTDGKYWRGFGGREFIYRTGLKIVEYRNRLWLIGGAGPAIGEFKSDVWSSSDADNWKLESEVKTIESNTIVDYSGRAGHGLVVFQDKLWLIGGYNLEGSHADVWYSSGGKNWIRQTNTAPFGKRSNHQTVVFKDKLYVIGGHSDTGDYLNDVWSFDGNNWVQETNEAGFLPRSSMNLAFLNSKWILVGGLNRDQIQPFLDDVWESDDLVNWVKRKDSIDLYEAHSQTLIEFDNKLWLTGLDGIRYSLDGINWSIPKENPTIYSPRYAHDAISFNGSMWVFGGFDGESRNDIYRTEDGVHWDKLRENAEFSPRSDHSVEEFNGRLWLIGGYGGEDDYNGAIWVSDDGIDWTLALDETPFPRVGNMVVSTGDTLFVMSDHWSVANQQGEMDVWKSTNGTEWELIVTTPTETLYSNPDAVYFNGKLWVIGHNTIKSADIETPAIWTSVALESGNIYHNEFVVHDNILYRQTYGGRTYSSIDGEAWTEVGFALVGSLQ